VKRLNHILIIGAGRSATDLIDYVLEKAKDYSWSVTVADADPELASRKIKNHPNGRAAWLDVTKNNDRHDGLITPENDTNPWNYKFTWNPRNVVLGGQGTAQYLEDGKYKYIPYNRLFQNYWNVDIEGMGTYEMYANRDSLLYRKAYGLDKIPTLLRGTLRNIGFCEAWNALIRIGLTDSSFPILESKNLSYLGLMEAYLGSVPRTGSVKEGIADFLGEEVDSEVMKKLVWLGLFRKKRIKLERATPALILERLLLKKWKLSPGDKDMIIMQHEFEYKLKGKKKKLISTLVMKGEDEYHTAMSRLVGVPLGIFVKEVMLGNITKTGVNIPVLKEVYEPVLEELKEYGVVFREKLMDLD